MDIDINSNARVVVILGMDRTGTSLCTNVLNELGMRLSPRLMPATEFNPSGHFEDEEIFLAHEWILAGLDRSWETLTTIHPLPAQWWEAPAMDPFRDKLVDIVRRRTAEGTGIWGFKDPRTALVLPLWNQAFRICGVSPVFVLCVRHPAAVARSLAARDGFSLLFSELLWFEKTLTGCLAIQDAPHCLIHYEEWFNDPLPQTRMLCKIAGLPPAGRPAALKARVSPIVNSELRHQDGGVIISTAARDLYAHLVQSAKVPDPEVLRHFEFASEVGRDFIATAEHLMGERYLGQSGSRERQSVLAEDRFRWILRCQGSERRLGEIEEDRARWIQRCSGAEHALGERNARLAEQVARLGEQDTRLAEQIARLAEQDARLAEQVACLGEQDARLGEQDARLGEQTARLAEQDARFAKHDAYLRELENDRARWIQRCSGAELALAERDARLRELEDDRARWIQRCSGAEHASVERDARLRELEEDRARWMDRCSGAEQEGLRWKEQFGDVTTMLSERDREIGAMRASATWRWTQSALSSWPARHLLGPVIRAVGGPRA